MRIIELLIDELDELSGVDAVALVNQPAIEAGFHAFNSSDIDDAIAFQVIKVAMEELTETEDIHELVIGDYQTRHYDMCPGASALYKKIESQEIDTDMGLAIRNAKLQDALFYAEKVAIKNNTASFEDVKAAEILAGEIMHLARMMGLEEEHQYVLGHLQAIRDLYQQNSQEMESKRNIEFESYNDYPESATNAAKRALEWRDSHPDNDCGTRVGWARANQLANRENISEETIARMASFARHLQHEDVPYSEGCGGLMVDAWGGRSGIEWAQRKLDSIKEENSVETQEFKGIDNRFKFAIDEDEQMVVGPLMIPDKLILRVDENDDPYYVFFSKNTIKEIAYKLMREKRLDSVNIEHNSEDTVDGYMVSSWIVEDMQKDQQQVYGFNFPVGTWMGQYKILNKDTWSQVKSGDLKGFSVEGFFQDKFIQASKK